MAAKKKTKKVLGRGLSALISSPAVPLSQEDLKSSTSKKTKEEAPLKVVQKETAEPQADGVQYLPINQLKNNPDQPRKKFDEEGVAELSRSIKEHGVLQPVLVRPATKDQFEIVAGERRWRAAKLAKLSQIPVIIKDISDKETLEIALIENIQRKNLSAIEEARAYSELISRFSLTQEEVAKRTGKDRTSVTNLIRLLKLPDSVQKMIEQNQISQGHARAILSVRDPVVQKQLAEKVLKERLSVREIEQIVSRTVVLKPGNQKRKKGMAHRSAFPDLEDTLRKKFGTKVKIQHRKNGQGSVSIEYSSEEDLDRIFSLIS